MLLSKICFCVMTMVSVEMFAGTEALPCKVPVFRYALEYWVPDSYEVVILHRGKLSEHEESMVAKMKEKAADSDGFINMRVQSINVEENGESKLLTQVLGSDFENTIVSPEIVLLYPAESQSGPLAWRGPLTTENVDALFDSPARKQITEWILDGESIVWVLVGVGDPKKDKPAEQLFLSEIPRLEKVIEMRDIDVIKSEKQFGKNTNVELRFGIKLLVLDRNDPKEKIFAATLVRSEKDLEELGQPFAIPVFGRGRAHLSLAGKGINPKMIEATCRFLIGDCSCEIKRLNPGVDLLFAVNWDELVGGTGAPNKPLPELDGVTTYVDVPPGNNDAVQKKPGEDMTLTANESVVDETFFGLSRIVWITALIGLILFVIVLSGRGRQ
jgi:hypothetical protein